MAGITLSADEIRAAPTEVRQWIEREISRSLGTSRLPIGIEGRSDHIVPCSMEELSVILAGIQNMLPVVNVFFELGREGLPVKGMVAFRLTDIVNNARLRSADEAMACLNIINRAVEQVRNDDRISFCGLDENGYCFVPQQTQRNLHSLWRDVVSSRPLDLHEAPQNVLHGQVTGRLQGIDPVISPAQAAHVA
jgi:hypothetical protein